MKKLMYKVIVSEGKIVLFEVKSHAEAYVNYLKSQNCTAFLNKWTWETEIEE